MKLLYLVVCCLLLTHVLGQSAADDLVDNFIPNMTSNWYSGYFNLSSGKNFHYVFFQSQKDRNNDSLIVFLGNGPGCSSLHAMTYENGPFKIENKGDLHFIQNPYGWNHQANVLYLETPAGVGFSEGNTTSSDENVTKDTLETLTYFLTRFPTYVKNDMYLAGTGYAGITVPYLALAILDHNESPVFHSKLNLKGVLLGNPCTSFDECYASGAAKSSFYHYEFLYNHGFLSDNMWNNFKSVCSFSYNSQPCFAQREILEVFMKKVNISNYNVYDPCYYTQKKNSTDSIDDNCEDVSGILRFLNDEEIQDILHVNRINFTVCNDNVFTKYIGNSTGSYWIYPKLIEKKQKIFIYSGDLDSSVPTIGTKTWVRRLREQLDIPVKKVWREWWVEDVNQKYDQVGGMVWELNTLTLATVRGAGMMVGREKPKELYTILDAFLNNKRLPVRK